MIKDWIDKTWWFGDEEGNIIFAVVIEYPKDKTPPQELVDMIELYRKGYRPTSASDRNPDPSRH